MVLATMDPLLSFSEASADELRRRLRSRTRGIGYRAAEELARLGEPGREMILSALRSRDRNVRLHAAWAVRLLDSTEAVRTVLELLRGDREFYLAAQQALARHPDPDLVRLLMDQARDRTNPNRKFHSMLLGDVAGPGVLDALFEGIQSEDLEVQEGSFLAFKHASDDLRRQAAPFLVQALSVRLPLPRRLPWTVTKRQKAVATVPMLLITAVGFSGGEPGVGVLTEIIRSDSHDSYRHAAISALVGIGEPAVARTWRLLLSLVETGADADLPASAAEALRLLKVEDAEPVLLGLLERGNPFQRRNAAHALEGCGSADAAPALHACLADPDVHVRRTAARTLGVLRDPRSLGPLTQALGDRDAWVAWNAAWALGQSKEPGLLPRLMAGLEGSDPRLRRNCAEALGQLGVATPEAIEALVAALGENSGAVARSAAWALRQLDMTEALGYAVQLLESPDVRQRRLGQRARYWLQPERASYLPHLPVRSSRRGGLYTSPPRKQPKAE